MANTTILALDKYPEDLYLSNITEKINMAFAAVFTIELILRMLAIGIKQFFKGSWLNTFDCVVVVGSMIDILMSSIIFNDDTPNSGSIVTMLRGIRLLRVFKLAKKWRRFELLLETLGKTLNDITNFAIFLSLFIFIFTLLSMEMFAYRAKLNPDTLEIDTVNGVSPTFNFDNFLNSFSLVFIILTNDGQAAIYYNYYRAVGAAQATIFFVLLVLVG